MLRTPNARPGKRGGPESLRRVFPETEATMLQHRPRASLRPWLRSLTVALCASFVLPAVALAIGDEDVRELPVERNSHGAKGSASGFSTANSNCAGAACDTVWVGHSNSGPGGAFLGVGVGGNWDFDTGTASTDSTQGWTRGLHRFHFSATRPVASRPEWFLDYGNIVNEGNTNLWAARDLAGRKYVKTGVAGVWHSDNMSGVKLNVANGAEPSATPIVGTRSAWCGLREAGNLAAQDALTGNYINGDLYYDIGPVYTANDALPEFPGFCNQWDQMLYKDFTSAGSGSVAFRVRTNISTFLDTATNGSGWYNPDPTSFTNYVHQPADSFMVYVGAPTEVAYDTNRRWFSEVLDLSKPHRELFAVSGVFPFVQPDTALSFAYSGLTPVGGKVRVVFRVKTNRARADASTATATGYNTKDGAAVLDAVQVNGGTTYGFETAASVTARSLAGDVSADGGPWVTTGKPPSMYMHVANISSLLYEDLCGAVGAPTRQCNLAGNVWVAGDADNGNLVPIETWQIIQSPTINLAVRNAAPGTKNAQGIDKETASRASAVMEFDLYSGFMSTDESVFYFLGARAYQPGVYGQPVSGSPTWSNGLYPPSISNNSVPLCYTDGGSLSSLGFTTGSVDSLKAILSVQTAGYRFGGTNLGNTRGTYLDNVRVGFVREAAPLITMSIWERFQDQFPWNEGVTPGDNASFDTTTALMNTGLNIVAPEAAPGVVAGDSIIVSSPWVGNGTSTGTRLDLVFRIDPGPGNYTIKGNRSSALVNKDPAHPFFAAYLANNGAFGTPGGHGGTWNRNVWNSARMDSADVNLYPVISRSIGGAIEPSWQGTLHEADPKYASLGIDHNLCFLLDPNGATNQTNIDCSGIVPAPYVGVSGTTKEGTKILPDGWFSPGTHIEWFVRQSTLENPTLFSMMNDTTTVWAQDPGGQPNFDAERFLSVDVLPDMWKSTRYGGLGLACMLMVDGADRRGADVVFRGAADTLGYGKNNGASQGWKGTGPAATSSAQADNPAGFIAANLGQYGLNYDHFDVNGAEGGEAGHPGSRFATNAGAIAAKGDKSGPSAAQLASFYNSVLYLAGDLDENAGTLQDGVSDGQGADDITLLQGFLAAATGANRKSIWLSGEGIMQDGAFRGDPTLYTFLTDTFGSDLTSENYKAFSLSPRQTVGLLPTASWAHPGRVYGLNHSCLILNDVLAVVPTVDGATEGSQYEHLGPGPWTSSVYRTNGAGREYRTLIDGFDLANVKGNYATLAAIATQPETDNGRIAWFDDVWSGLFQLCARRGPVIGVGDVPGSSGGRFANANLGSFPNPAFSNQHITLRFTLAQARPVTVRIYSVAGREVAKFEHKGVEGPNNVVWDGALANGARAVPGVYFYRIDAPGFDQSNSAQKMILLSSN